MTLVLIILFLSNSFTTASTTESQTITADTVTFMAGMAEFANKHKGEKLAVLIDKIRECGMPIKFISVRGEGYWTDPQGKAHIGSAIVSCYDLRERYKRHQPVPVLDITLKEPYMDADLYDHEFGYLRKDRPSAEELADMLKDRLVMSSAEFYVMPRTNGK